MLSETSGEQRMFVTLILRLQEEGRGRSGCVYFDADTHHGSLWNMECPELGFSGGFYNSRDAAIDQAFLMFLENAVSFTVTRGMPPEYVAARAALLNAPEKAHYMNYRERGEAEKARLRFGGVVRIIDGEPFTNDDISLYHLISYA